MGVPGRTVWERFATWVATGFGIGLVAPVAPGTVGSLPGVALALALAAWVPDWRVQAVICVALTLASIPVCDVAERVLGRKDDGRICADEWMLYPIGVLGLPLLDALWLVPVTFVVIRVIDIVKPPPARQLQVLKGGLGIVADDFAANLISLGLNWGFFRLVADLM